MHVHARRCQTPKPSSPIFNSCITAPVFYLPEVSSGLEAACTPRPAQPCNAGKYSKHQLGGFIVTCSLQLWFHGSSHSSTFCRAPESQLCPKEGQPHTGWRTAITTRGTCSRQAEITSHSPRFSMRLLHHHKRSSALESRRDVVYRFTSIVLGMPQSNLKYHQLNH